MTFKYFKNYFGFFLSHILAGTTHYEEKRAAYYSLHSAKIRHKKLARLLEATCQEKGGILTYPEYLAVEQFSQHGFHGRHLQYGRTFTVSYWPKPLLALCKQYDMHHLIEFGPGEGALGIRTVQQAKKEDYPLSWAGIEIDEDLQQEIRKVFQKNKLEKQLDFVAPSLEKVGSFPKSLFVFSYSLDSIPPYLFTNTKAKRSFPNALIGIKAANGITTEKILTKEELAQKKLSFRKGIFTDESGQSYDLTTWQLLPMQRAYIPLASYHVLQQTIQKLPKGSRILIIDELRDKLPRLTTQHLFPPRDVEVFDRDVRNMREFYHTAGEKLLYYLSFRETYTSLLKQLGCAGIQFAEEKKAAFSIEKGQPLGDEKSSFSYCYALLATTRGPQKKTKPLSILFASQQN